jgi:hypothetical protein
MVSTSRQVGTRSITVDEPIEAQIANVTSDDREVAELAWRLLDMVLKINTQEFYGEEAHYERDSRQGRELLFLLANYEWICATSEIVDISRSDAIETLIKIDIDLDKITHEAFRSRSGQIWLPITILAPQAESSSEQKLGGRYLEPDPFATVTDAAGNLLPLLPAADLRHQMSAAMAEIIVNMAVAHWPGAAEDTPTATRDERLLLSAAICRMLRPSTSQRSDMARPETNASLTPDMRAPGSDKPTPRMVRAKQQLTRLLGAYISLLDSPADITGAEETEREAPQFAPEFARRAISVLQSLAESIIVVVPIDHGTAPTVLTVRVPTRNLISDSSWSLLKPRTWMIRPLGRLELDVLLPTSDADRQIQIRLPDGVCFDEPAWVEGGRGALPHLKIQVGNPPPLQDLSAAMEQVLDRTQAWPPALLQSFIDLTRAKAALAVETLKHYEVAAPASGPDPLGREDDATDIAHDSLMKLAVKLDQSEIIDDVVLAKLSSLWQECEQSPGLLFRRASADTLNPRTVVARTEVIEDATQRAVPESAKIYADITVDDRDYFSVARASTGMSLILMTAVLCFLVGWRLIDPKVTPAPEVLAIVLTLFAAIQAGRIEPPDRSTLRGQLSGSGYWLIAASMVPAVILAIALAFRPGGWAAPGWAAGCIGLQVALQTMMRRGPLTPGGSPDVGQRRIFRTLPTDYRRLEALRTDYWRSTVADALMIGRQAYGYVVWQKIDPSAEAESASPQLKPLLTWQQGSSVSDESTSVLALLHAGTLRQAVTFVVFRGRPSSEWSAGAQVRAELDLDPSRLAPMESITSMVDVFVGVSCGQLLTVAEHPVAEVLKAAAHRLIVLEIQLPIPEPVDGYEGRHWARVRVALRDKEDIRRLQLFLNSIYNHAIASGNEHVVAFQTVPACYPRVITPIRKASAAAENGALVLTHDLDVVNNAARLAHEDVDARAWRLITMCTDARSNIESEILRQLALVRPAYHLAGLTYGLLHGMALMILLVHEPQGADMSDRRGSAHLESDMRNDPGLAKLQVVIYEELSRQELGPISAYPMLRVRYRWQDHPGAFLNVLDSISNTLCDEVQSIKPNDWSVSYARIQIVTGRIALGRAALRLHATAGDVESWGLRKMEEIELKVGALASQKVVQAPSASIPGADPERPEDLVISIDLIRRLKSPSATPSWPGPAPGAG